MGWRNEREKFNDPKYQQLVRLWREVSNFAESEESRNFYETHLCEVLSPQEIQESASGELGNDIRVLYLNAKVHMRQGLSKEEKKFLDKNRHHLF